MKKTVLYTLLFAVTVAAGYFAWSRCFARRSLVILSTTDVHAKIDNLPRLATAAAMCRDTVPTLLADAGDRWTGNAFVDMAEEPRRPVIDMMNELGYDIATLGNHEFDGGQAFLGRMNSEACRFDIVCANCLSDTVTFPQPAPYRIIRRGGVRIGVVGVVTNYDHNDHPAGNDANFVGLTFPDPQVTAAKYAAELKGRCDVLVLLSHMGDDMDAELARKCGDYDLILCGHTHNMVDTLINGTLLGQSGYGAKHVGVTRIEMRGRRIVGLDYEVIPLADYDPDPEFEKRVAAVYDNESLNRPLGESKRILTRTGLAALETDAMRRRVDADVAFYHYGGIRFDSLPDRAISTGMIFSLEPFSSKLCTMDMTPEQMRRMIIAKYNDTDNPKESHRVDIFSNVPYKIVTGADGEARDVVFDGLAEGRSYRVVMGDYMYNNYKAVEAANAVCGDILLTEVLMDDLRENSPIDYSNERVQTVVKEGE